MKTFETDKEHIINKIRCRTQKVKLMHSSSMRLVSESLSHNPLTHPLIHKAYNESNSGIHSIAIQKTEIQKTYSHLFPMIAKVEAR